MYAVFCPRPSLSNFPAEEEQMNGAGTERGFIAEAAPQRRRAELTNNAISPDRAEWFIGCHAFLAHFPPAGVSRYQHCVCNSNVLDGSMLLSFVLGESLDPRRHRGRGGGVMQSPFGFSENNSRKDRPIVTELGIRIL